MWKYLWRICFWIYPKLLVFFYSEMRNVTVLLKRSFVFLQRNTKFNSCTQPATYFFFLTAKYKTLQFIVLVKRSSLTAKYKISKTVCKWPFVKQPLVLWLPSAKLLKLFPKSHSFFDHEIQILKFSWNCLLFFWL